MGKGGWESVGELHPPSPQGAGALSLDPPSHLLVHELSYPIGQVRRPRLGRAGDSG